MGQESLLSVVEAFRVSQGISDDDRDRLTEMQKAAAAVGKSAPSAFGKAAAKAGINSALAGAKTDYVSGHYKTSGGWKFTVDKVKAPTLKSTGKDLITSWAKGAVRARMKAEGGGFAYVAWAWEGWETAAKMLKPGHPAIKVLELGLFVNKAAVAAQKTYLDKQTAAMAAEIDWILKTHSDVTDRLLGQARSMVEECQTAGMKVVPKWKLDDRESFVQRLISAINDVQSGDGQAGKMFVQSNLRRNLLNDLAYLHDLRAGAYSLGAASDAWSDHLKVLADNPEKKSVLPAEMQNYSGYVKPGRADIFRMLANDLHQSACGLRAATEGVFNVETNLWYLLGQKLGLQGAAPG
jgi:hypothetical protein